MPASALIAKPNRGEIVFCLDPDHLSPCRLYPKDIE
jgi:hypothetical protein